MRLTYTTCSKNLTNKDIHEIFPANDGNFIRRKEAKKKIENIYLFLTSKNTGTNKYPRIPPKHL